MSTIYRVPCKITATNNDHLMIISVDIVENSAPFLITGLRAMQNLKLHKLVLWDPYRDLTITPVGNSLSIALGDHKSVPITPENLDFLEDYTLDWLLERCSSSTRCNICLNGSDDLRVDLTFRLRKSDYNM